MIRTFHISFLTMILAISGVKTAVGQNLVINELMQSNVDEIMDDLNEFPDSWVEVYNLGPETANLVNYRIGITPDPNAAWALPAYAIPAGGHAIIYCDKEAQGLHSDFRLDSGKGCQVYLFMGASIIDQVEDLPKQPAPNVAYGRKTDGSVDWGYQLITTPGYSNSNFICDHDHILGNPIFSEPGSVQTGSRTILLELSVPEGSPEGTVIHYTTDGREPTRSDRRYSSPILITATSIIRAKLFCDGWLSPRSTAHSYILFPRDLTLPVISITTDDSYMNDSQIGIFPNNDTSNRTLHHNWRRPANIEYFESEGVPSAINQLGEIRVGGGTTRENSRKTLVVYANKRFGTKRFSYEFFPDQKPGLTEFKSFLLRNAGNDFNSLFMRDAIAQRNMGSNADLDWQAWSPAIVFINGEYYSMLNIRERDNEDNIYTNYNGLEDIDLIENWDDLKEGDFNNFYKFEAFYHNSHTFAEYEEWMDCEEFINLMIMDLYHNNLDFPGNNIIIWRPRAEGGRWRWIAKDVDYSLGMYNIPYTYKIFRWFYDPKYDPTWYWGANHPEYTFLFRHLMENTDFKNMFIERSAIYMGDFLNERGIHKVWDPMYEKIKYEYPYHRMKISRYPDYNKEMQHVNDWVAHRSDEFYKQISNFYDVGNPIPLEINTNQQDSPLTSLSFNGVTLSEGQFDGKFYPNHTIRLDAKPKEGMELMGWWIQQTNGSSTTSQEYMITDLDMEMPVCSRLVIEPICYNIANGIINIGFTPTTTKSNDVYDLNGRKVRSGSTSLDGLPRGIYIVGGRKVIK
ncbi:MAG: CotH kinase family protein [Prevotella sp.]|nr:CotH kinase family protein [Prevotella sp.]